MTGKQMFSEITLNDRNKLSADCKYVNKCVNICVNKCVNKYNLHISDHIYEVSYSEIKNIII